MSGMPWQDDSSNPFVKPGVPPIPKRVRWDYIAETIVDDGAPTLFDTTWTYWSDRITVTGWWVLKDPWSSPQYLLEAEVPEMVRFAVMVT